MSQNHILANRYRLRDLDFCAAPMVKDFMKRDTFSSSSM